MLNQAEVDAIAKDIYAQHERGDVFRPFPDRVPSGEDAVKIQDAYVAMLKKKFGTDVGGYKIALTSKQTREWLKIHEPCAGQVLANRIHKSPFDVKVSDYVRFSMETEVCVVLDKDMSGPCTIPDVQKNIRSLHCAYELVEDRAADLTKLDAKSLVSDNSWNAGIVMGPAAPNPKMDLANLKGRFKVNGVVTHQGTTAETMNGNPLFVVAWLVEHLGKRGRSLKAGQPVITGSLIATQFPVVGDELEFEVDGIPPVKMKLVP
jgi:2-keto-4-pentenoate hydratase